MKTHPYCSVFVYVHCMVKDSVGMYCQRRLATRLERQQLTNGGLSYTTNTGDIRKRLIASDLVTTETAEQ